MDSHRYDSLLIVQGADQGRRIALDGERLRIGRGAQNDLRILDTEVSRQHAALERTEDGWRIVDRHSSNGTFVNGEAIQQAILRNGDQLQLGRSVLLFTATGSRSAVRAEDQINLIQATDDSASSAIVGEVEERAGRELVNEIRTGVGTGRSQPSHIQALLRISEEAVRGSVPIGELLQRILDLTIAAVGADRGCLLVADHKTDRILPRVVSYREQVDPGERIPISTTIVEHVLERGHGVRTSDAQADERFAAGQSILQSGIREAMCIPLKGRYELMGVMYVDTTTPADELVLTGRQPGHRFSEELLTLLLAVGQQCALAIENNRYQEALLKAERLAAVGQTIATLSHHVKNILQGVRGGSYLIDMGLNKEDSDLVRKGWNIVEKNQDKIYHLVMDMLTFSKERQPVLAAGQVNETVADVIELMQGRAAEVGITLENSLADDLPVTLFDTEGIHRAVLNLITNAFDALDGQQDGIVRVETRFDSTAKELAIAVIDNGPGIPQDEQERIFNIFESGKGSRGTGLGLAVTRKIIQEHGGRVSVESTPGEGTCFRLTWPHHEEDVHGESAKTFMEHAE